MFRNLALFGILFCFSFCWAADVSDFGGLSMPSKTWISVPSSSCAPGSPGYSGTSKHLRMATNLTNGRTYFMGGDWTAVGPVYSDVQLWSVDIANNSWRLEIDPPCGQQGEVIPGGPDEVGWVWDSKSQRFWVLPGEFWFGAVGAGSCQPGGSSGIQWDPKTQFVGDGYWVYQVLNVLKNSPQEGKRYVNGTDFTVAYNTPSTGKLTITNLGGIPSEDIRVYYQSNGPARQVAAIMTYDPVAHKWEVPGAPEGPHGGSVSNNGIYDPVTNSIYRAGPDNGGNNSFQIFDIAKNTWTVIGANCAQPGSGDFGSSGPCGEGTIFINNTSHESQYIAADIAGRKIYVMDVYWWRLIEFDMDTHVFTIRKAPSVNPDWIAMMRAQVYGTAEHGFMVWDNINNVLLYPVEEPPDGDGCTGYPNLWIYHPVTDIWEHDSMFQPEGQTVRGQNFCFDPVHNALISIGGFGHGWVNDPSIPYFLYRYGNGVPDTSAPSVPSGLSAGVISPTCISLTWAASTDNQYVAGYHIYRDNNKIGTSAGAAYSDTTVNNTQSYVYRVSAFDAKGNESAMSDPVTSNTDIPIFTSIEKDSVLAGEKYGFKIKYYSPKSANLTLDIQKKPSWTTIFAGQDSIYGTAPAENRVDTLFAVLKNNNVSVDTLLVCIFTRSVSISRSLATGKAVNELSIVSTSNANTGMDFTVGLPHAGSFDLQVFDIAGKKVWSLREGISSAGYYRVSWNLNGAQKTGNGLYVVSLKQGRNEKRVKFISVK